MNEADEALCDQVTAAACVLQNLVSALAGRLVWVLLEAKRKMSQCETEIIFLCLDRIRGWTHQTDQLFFDQTGDFCFGLLHGQFIRT